MHHASCCDITICCGLAHYGALYTTHPFHFHSSSRCCCGGGVLRFGWVLSPGAATGGARAIAHWSSREFTGGVWEVACCSGEPGWAQDTAKTEVDGRNGTWTQLGRS